jgi:soluble lytic murein transglycosylase-like protein
MKNINYIVAISALVSALLVVTFMLGAKQGAGEVAILEKSLFTSEFSRTVLTKKLEKANSSLDRFRTPEKQNRELGQFVMNLMTQSEVDMSPARQQIIARTVVRVTNDVFDKPEHKRWFATVLAIESRFDKKAKSRVGATGIAQLMPRYAKKFAQMCGIDDYHPSDLKDTELNMTFGACLFRTLLESDRIKGNVNAALVGYNAGTKSKSLVQLQRMMNISNKETVNYIARWNFVSESAKNILNEDIKAQPEQKKNRKKPRRVVSKKRRKI